MNQKLKRGILEAQQRLRPLSVGSVWVSCWLLLEVFAGQAELTLQAEPPQCRSLQPVDILHNDDLYQSEVRSETLREIGVWEPDLITWAPSCGPWSSLNNFNRADFVRELQEAHHPFWRVVKQGWEEQTVGGRLTLTEQPRTATSRRLPRMEH